MTYTKLLLSGSVNGKQIKVTSITNGAADTVHTAVAGTAALDEVWLYAYNENTAPVLLTLLWGGTTEPDNVTRITLPAQSGRTLLMDGMLLQNGLVIKVYASVTNVVLLDGFVNNVA